MKNNVHPKTLLFALTVFSFFYAQSVSAQEISTFSIQKGILDDNKRKIKQGDEALVNALSELKVMADKALTNGPYSVVYKEETPPSGDKHDYMSVGPYWWPDDTKPDGLPYIRKDGVTNPERYKISDVRFHNSLCSSVALLSLYTYFTGEKEYGEKAVELLRVWFLDEETRMNPNLNFGQSIPGIVDGRGIGLIDTRALTRLIDGVQLLKVMNAISEEDYAGIQDWYSQFLDWMLTSPIGQQEERAHNNHGTYYDVQTVCIALFTNQRELAMSMIEEKTKRRIENQLEVDGRQPHELERTNSWGYSMMNLKAHFELAALAENVDIDLWNYTTPNDKSIKKAFTWLLPYAEGKKWEYEQINGFKEDGLVELATLASAKYDNISIKDYLVKYPDKLGAVFLLTNPRLK